MDFDIQVGWGKAVPLPPHPIYIPPDMQEEENAKVVRIMYITAPLIPVLHHHSINPYVSICTLLIPALHHHSINP